MSALGAIGSTLAIGGSYGYAVTKHQEKLAAKLAAATWPESPVSVGKLPAAKEDNGMPVAPGLGFFEELKRDAFVEEVKRKLDALMPLKLDQLTWLPKDSQDQRSSESD